MVQGAKAVKRGTQGSKPKGSQPKSAKGGTRGKQAEGGGTGLLGGLFNKDK